MYLPNLTGAGNWEGHFTSVLGLLEEPGEDKMETQASLSCQSVSV